MSIGRAHPIWPPLEPDLAESIEAEEREAARRANAAGLGVVVIMVVGIAVTGVAGVYAMLHADWRFAAEMLAISMGGIACLPFAWRSRRPHVDPLTGRDPPMEAAENRAMREALESYDRLLAREGPFRVEPLSDRDREASNAAPRREHGVPG